jgi:hypothetical protein
MMSAYIVYRYTNKEAVAAFSNMQDAEDYVDAANAKIRGYNPVHFEVRKGDSREVDE